MHRLKTILAGVAVVCLAVPLQAYKPAEPSKSAGLQKSLAQKGADPFARGLKNLRRLTLDDLFDSAQDVPARQLTIKNPSGAGLEVPDRLNKKLRSLHSTVRVTRIDRDKLGLLHIRLSQFHRGIPVIGSDMIVHIDKSNKVFAVSGTLAPSTDIDTAASVRLPQARLAAEQSVTNGSRSPLDSSKLVVFDGKLAYEVLVAGKNGQPELYKCYLDAKTGELLYKQSQIMPSAPSSSGAHVLVSGTRLTGEGGNVVSMTGWHDAGGNYFLYNKDSVWGVYNLVSGDWEQRAASSWGTSDPAAVSLGKNFSIIQNYVRNVLGMYGFNNAGAFARANVHEGTLYVNAYWDGTDFHFGDGDGVEANALTVLDVAAHEYGHAITQYSSNLVYSYESGALNESYSDIMGTLVEFWAQPDGRSSYPSKTTAAADWLCGEDCWLSGVALRDLRNPQRFGQPSYYLGSMWYTGGGDNGGVHYNSGVQNFAFYLLAEGGSGTNDGHSYNITGLGIQHAGDVALYANMHLLTSSAQYRDTRDAWIMAASLLGYNAMTVADVWTACGVLPLVKHLSVSPASLAFGSVGAGSSDTLSLLLSNNGASSTIVTGLTSGDPWFTAAAAVPFTVAGGGTYTLKVACNPSAYESRTSALTIASNADDNPSISVGLSGTGVAPAVMSLTPSSLHATVLAGDSLQQTLQCSNTGTAPLKIRITKTEVDTPVATWKGVQRWNYSISPENGNDGSARPVQAAATESAIVTSPFFDGFEQGNFNNWTPGSGSYVRSVTNATAASGQYSFTQSGGNSTHFDGVSATLAAPQQPDRISFSVRAQSNTLYHGYFVLCGAGNSEVIWFSMGGTGYLFANGNETYPYIGNTWYTIRFQLNWVAATFDYYVNNVLVASAIPFRNNTPITTIYLYNFYNSQAWWDNINFGGASESTWLTCALDTATVFSGHTVTIPVAMNSTGLTGGNYAGSLSIFHNAPATPSPKAVLCTLTVRGVRRLAVSPTAYSFGNVWAGAHASATFTLKNPGTEATQVDSIVCGNPAFAQASSLPLVVRANDSARVTVTFSPPVTGPYTGTVSIKSNAEDNPVLAVPVSGTGTSAPIARLTPTSLAYSLRYTDSPVAQVSALSNIGGDLLTYIVTTAEVSRPAQGAPGLAWLSVTPASGSLLPGAQQNLTIVVNPAGCAAGEWVGRVMVNSNDPVNPQVIVTVTADIAGCKKLSSDKNQLDFGTVWTGANKPLTLTLANSCNDSVTVSALDFNNPLFSSNAVLPLKVPAFGSAAISVSFAPVDSGAYSGGLSIRSNAEDNPSIDVSLLGWSRVPPSIVVTPGALTRALNGNDSAGNVLTIVNSGGDTLHFSITRQGAGLSLKSSMDSVMMNSLDSAQRSFSIAKTTDTVRNTVANVCLAPGSPGETLNKKVLMVQDVLPWGYNVIEPILVSMGASVTKITSSQIASCNFSQYNAIVVPSVQGSTFYANYRANKIKFESYVQAGGVLEFHCATQGDTFSLPGGVIVNYLTSSTNYVVNRTHQITAGVDSTLTGSSASHTWFSNVPPAATTLIKNAGNQPTLITYKLGSGSIVATGMTWEFYYPSGLGNPLMPNALNYSMSGAGSNQWLTINKADGSIGPRDSTTVLVTFNTTGMVAGRYPAQLNLQHNAPAGPNPYVVPCTLTVNGTRHCAVSPLAFSFGGLWVGRETTTTVTLLNNGNEPTLVSSITGNSPAFFSRTALPVVVPAYGSATITATFLPVAAGPVSETLTIQSNAMDNPELTVSLSGAGILPPRISTAPQAISERLGAGGTASKTLTVFNTGGDNLHFTSAAVDMTSGVNAAAVPLYGPEHFVPIAKGEPDNRMGHPVASMKGGPDSYGYRWVDSDDPSGPAFLWDDIVASGTRLTTASGCDDCTQLQPLSFSFTVYGNNFTSCIVSSNGCITFGTANASYSNCPLPSTGAPANLIAAFWDDLYPAGGGGIYFKDYGNKAVIQYQAVPTLSGGGSLTFQIVLNRDGSILLYYKTVTGTLTSGTTGIQNQSGTTGLTIAYNTTYVKNNLAIRISTRPAWLSINMASGAILPSGSVPIAVTLDATQLIQGTYTGAVRFTHDDPSMASPLDIPVSLLVSPTGGLKCAVLRIGPSMVASAQGTSYRVKTVTLGDVTAGVMRGNLYQLRLLP